MDTADSTPENSASSPSATGAEFATTLLATFVTFMGFYSPQPLFSTISQHFQVSPSQTGLLMTLTIAPFIIGPLLYGKILRILTIKQLLCVLLPIGALTLFPPAFATWFPVLLVCRLCQGITLPDILMCLSSHVASRYSGATLQRKMALYATATTLGAFSGRVIGSYIGMRWGWQMTFIVLGVLQLIILIPLFLFFNDAQKKGAGTAFSIHDMFSLLGNRPLLLAMLIAPLVIFCHASILNLLPFYLRRLDPGMNDFVIGLVYIGGVIGGFVGLGSRQIIKLFKGEWNVILGGLTLFLVSLPLLFLRSVPGTVLTMLGTGIAFSLVYTTIPGIINRVSHMPKSLTNSVYLAIYYLLSAMGTYIPILVFSRAGLAAYELLLLGVFAVTFCIALRARSTTTLD